MDHNDHVTLLRRGIPASGGIWGDLGCGTGAFTLALADLIGSQGVIYAVDKDRAALFTLAGAMHDKFPGVDCHTIGSDFTQALELPPLDGIIMANSLHFITPQQKPALIQRVKNYLKPSGCMVVVEYNVKKGNIWVPYPFTFSDWQKMACQAGFNDTCLLATHPSHFLHEFYAALSMVGG